MILQQCRLLNYVIPAPFLPQQILSCLGTDVVKKPDRQFFTGLCRFPEVAMKRQCGKGVQHIMYRVEEMKICII